MEDKRDVELGKRVATCPNRHEVSPELRLCPTCGERIEDDAPARSAEDPVETETSRESHAHRSMWGAVGLVVAASIVLVVVIVAAARPRHQDSSTTAGQQVGLDDAAHELVSAWDRAATKSQLAGGAGYLEPQMKAARATLSQAWDHYVSVAASVPGSFPSQWVPTRAQIDTEEGCLDDLLTWFEAHPNYQPGAGRLPPDCGGRGEG
jgi:hypothetical protein